MSNKTAQPDPIEFIADSMFWNDMCDPEFETAHDKGARGCEWHMSDIIEHARVMGWEIDGDRAWEIARRYEAIRLTV